MILSLVAWVASQQTSVTDQDTFDLPIVVVTTEATTPLERKLVEGIEHVWYARSVIPEEKQKLSEAVAKARELGYHSTKLPYGDKPGDFLLFYPKGLYGFDDYERQIQLLKAIPAAMHGDRLVESDLPPEDRTILRGMGYGLVEPSLAQKISTQRDLSVQLGLSTYLDYNMKGGKQTFWIRPPAPKVKEVGPYITGPETTDDLPDSEKAKPDSQTATFLYPRHTPVYAKLIIQHDVNAYLTVQMKDIETRYGTAVAPLIELAKENRADFMKAFGPDGFDASKLNEYDSGEVSENMRSDRANIFAHDGDAFEFMTNNRPVSFHFEAVLSFNFISNVEAHGYSDHNVYLPLRPPFDDSP